MSDKKETITVTHSQCPICRQGTSIAHFIEEVDKTQSVWYQCNCGIVFQNMPPKEIKLTEEQIVPARKIHGIKTYLNVFQELTYGRKFVPVEDDEINDYLEEQGWVMVAQETCIPDLIICEDLLEHQDDPIDFLKLSYETLSKQGILYIDTPDTDFIARTNIIYFRHWKSNENYILWNTRSLVRELERIGFKIILTRRNGTTRYRKPDTVQVIAQKQ